MDRDRFGSYKNRDKNDENARGKRREFVVSLRKDKRRQKVYYSGSSHAHS